MFSWRALVAATRSASNAVWTIAASALGHPVNQDRVPVSRPDADRVEGASERVGDAPEGAGRVVAERGQTVAPLHWSDAGPDCASYVPNLRAPRI